MTETNGNNVKDWVIRSEAPTSVTLAHGERSQTIWEWVRDA